MRVPLLVHFALRASHNHLAAAPRARAHARRRVPRHRLAREPLAAHAARRRGAQVADQRGAGLRHVPGHAARHAGRGAPIGVLLLQRRGGAWRRASAALAETLPTHRSTDARTMHMQHTRVYTYLHRTHTHIHTTNATHTTTLTTHNTSDPLHLRILTPSHPRSRRRTARSTSSAQ